MAHTFPLLRFISATLAYTRGVRAGDDGCELTLPWPHCNKTHLFYTFTEMFLKSIYILHTFMSLKRFTYEYQHSYIMLITLFYVSTNC